MSASKPELPLACEAATGRLGAAFADAGLRAGVVYLEGELGAGKTTFVRGFLRRLGVEGAVRSPTFTLVEPYRTAQIEVYHCDLYRLVDPEELEYLGLRDHLGAGSLCLLEWPERGRGFLPAADLRLRFRHAGHTRTVGIEADADPYTRIAASAADLFFSKHSNT